MVWHGQGRCIVTMDKKWYKPFCNWSTHVKVPIYSEFPQEHDTWLVKDLVEEREVSLPCIVRVGTAGLALWLAMYVLLYILSPDPHNLPPWVSPLPTLHSLSSKYLVPPSRCFARLPTVCGTHRKQPKKSNKKATSILVYDLIRNDTLLQCVPTPVV